MTPEEAKEIIRLYEKWIDSSCCCFQGHPPCGKCEQMPSDEDYNEALRIEEENEM